MARNPNKDKLKSNAVLRKQYGMTCVHEDCNKELTAFEGPGDELLCREHQTQLVEYGGYGKLDRLHTFHRNDVCDCCGKDIMEDDRWETAAKHFAVELSPKQTHEIKRRYMHGDHDFRKADGGGDTADNLNSYCSFCHWVKTVISGDGLSNRLTINE